MNFKSFILDKFSSKTGKLFSMSICFLYKNPPLLISAFCYLMLGQSIGAY